jgi:hypothetical protein
MTRLKDKNFISLSVDELANTINEQSSEERNMLNTFGKAMNNFASERSLESCLDALNASMQINQKIWLPYEYIRYLLT